MTVIIENKSEYIGSITNTSLSYQNILNLSREDKRPFFVEGYLNLGSMATDDAINIMESVWANASLIVYAEENYSNAQSEPLIGIHAKLAPYGIYNLKMNQSYGTSKDYQYHFIVLNLTG